MTLFKRHACMGSIRGKAHNGRVDHDGRFSSNLPLGPWLTSSSAVKTTLALQPDSGPTFSRLQARPCCSLLPSERPESTGAEPSCLCSCLDLLRSNRHNENRNVVGRDKGSHSASISID